MTRIAVLTDDLLFGSRLQGDLSGAGHEVTLAATPDAGAELIVADLTSAAPERIAQIAALGSDRPPVLAFFSHVETSVREAAAAAGLDLVVPRSRMARESAALVRLVRRKPSQGPPSVPH
jgi:DNA-binding NarL/FixJ family response regulator